MARGQAQAADTQRRTTNQIGATNFTEQQALENKLTPGYTSLMNTGYFTPAEESAAVTSEMGSTASPFEATKFEAANRAGRTGNAADITAQEDQLALEEGRAFGDTAAKLQEQKMQNQLAGMYGLTDQEKINAGLTESMYGLGPATLQARAAGPSGDQTALNWAKFAMNPTGTGQKG